MWCCTSHSVFKFFHYAFIFEVFHYVQLSHVQLDINITNMLPKYFAEVIHVSSLWTMIDVVKVTASLVHLHSRYCEQIGRGGVKNQLWIFTIFAFHESISPWFFFEFKNYFCRTSLTFKKNISLYFERYICTP